MDRLVKGDSSASASNGRIHRYSNTPQGRIENIDDHLTEANKEDTTGSSTSSGKNDEKYTLVKRGNIGVQPLGGEVENIRHAFINIDMQIIEDLRDLFLLVY